MGNPVLGWGVWFNWTCELGDPKKGFWLLCLLDLGSELQGEEVVI